MGYTHVLVERSGDFATITMHNPAKRNSLSREHMRELVSAFPDVGASDALGVVLAANGPVFAAGHDFADVVDHQHADVRELLVTCTGLMQLMQEIPQPVVARSGDFATITTRGPRRPAVSSSRAPTSRSRPSRPASACRAARAAGSATRRWSGRPQRRA